MTMTLDCLINPTASTLWRFLGQEAPRSPLSDPAESYWLEWEPAFGD